MNYHSTVLKRQITKLLFTVALLTVVSAVPLQAQFTWLKNLLIPGEHDSNYITTFPDDITARFLTSTKNNQFRIFDDAIPVSLVYKPNNRAITGLGAHYGLLGFNVGFAPSWNVANKDDHIYGKTDLLDLQAHLYFRSFMIDLYYLNYRGLYLENSYGMLDGWPAADTFMIRGDMRVVGFGGSFHYFFNKRKFSYKAIFNQNEWQRKSAGSLILGGGIYFFPITADSSMVPENLNHDPFFGNLHFNKADLFSVGPTVGYTHTFVMWKKFFINLSLAGGITAGYTRLEGQESDSVNNTGFTWHFLGSFRAGMGYNSDRWFAGISYINNAIRNQAGIDQAWLQFDAGIFQFTLARRFHLKKPFKLLRPEYW